MPVHLIPVREYVKSDLVYGYSEGGLAVRAGVKAQQDCEVLRPEPENLHLLAGAAQRAVLRVKKNRPGYYAEPMKLKIFGCLFSSFF